MKTLYTFIMVGLLGSLTLGPAFGVADAKDDVLFTYGKNNVHKAEFRYIYDKNNQGKKNAYSEASIKEYLDLYVNFKLKVREAEDLGIDTLEEIKKELATYRKQLAKSYLVDREVNEQLLREAYERLQEEVKARHILINVGLNAMPEDTLVAHEKILNIRKSIVDGKDFGETAKELSEDPSAKENGGDLGYFTALQMVYPFENAAFNTPVGQISKPVRTRFGYHIVKTEDRRKSRGQILVAHIFIKIPKNAKPEQLTATQSKIDDIYNKLEAGGNFEQLAKQFSEDKTSASSGGNLPWFGAGRMVAAFENAAFSLKNNGDYSKPVNTEYGWHIIKRLDKKDLPVYDEIKDEIKKKIERDSRSEVSKKMFLKKIQKENEFKEYPKAKAKLLEKIDESILKSGWKANMAPGMKDPLFTLKDQKYSQEKFAKYIERNQRKRLKGSKEERFNQLYAMWVTDESLAFEENQLEDKYPEFKSLMGEYRDGILLFELTDRKVWSKAVEDTTGLKSYYDTQKGKYMWGDRLRGTVFRCVDKETADSAKALLGKNLSNAEVLNSINTSDQPNNIRIEEDGTFEKEQNLVVDQIVWKMGLSRNVTREEGGVSFVKVTGLYEAEPKTLDEAKGYVVADYQEHLEKEWLKKLRSKYPVKVNDEVLKSLMK